MSKKSTNALIAERSLEIIREGRFFNEGHEIIIKNELNKSLEGTITASPEELDELIRQELPAGRNITQVEVIRSSTVEAIIGETSGLKTAVLNFASAKNPGGGFLGGATAQEESLARSSSLYASLTKDLTMYTFNRSRSTFLYSDYMIYSPDVLFWMNDDGDFLESPLRVDVITSPAPNKGAMLQHQRQHEIDQIEETFRLRIDKLFALALRQNAECLILGAWGCGVFQNNPDKVARYFKEALDTKYAGQFKRIVFAIYGRKDLSVINSFSEAFEIHSNTQSK